MPLVGGEDDWGHGTGMAGVIAGGGVPTDEAPRGIAPGARIVSVKAIANAGVSKPGDGIIKALNWLKSRDDIRLINISLGIPQDCRTLTNPPCAVCTAVNRAVTEFNKIVVVSAGNDPANREVTCPGHAEKAITVGSATWRLPRDVSTFSSFNTTGKPDLLACGEDVAMPVARFGISSMKLESSGALSVELPPAPRFEPEHAPGTGTSPAAAAVTGLVALLLQWRPTWTASDVKDLLKRTAGRLAGVSADAQGAGLVDAAKISADLLRVRLEDVSISSPSGRRSTTEQVEARVINDTADPLERVFVFWTLRGQDGMPVCQTEAELSAPLPAGTSGNSALVVANLAIPQDCPDGVYDLVCAVRSRSAWDEPVAHYLSVTEEPERNRTIAAAAYTVVGP